MRSSFNLGNEIPIELSLERVKEIRKDYITRHKEVSSILFGIENSATSDLQLLIPSVAPVRHKSKILPEGTPMTPTSDKLRTEGYCQETGPMSPLNQKNFLSSFWDTIVDSVSSPIAIFRGNDPESTEKDELSTDKGLEGYRDAVEEEQEDDLSTIATNEVYYSDDNGKDVNEFERRLALQRDRRCTDSGSFTSMDDGDQEFFNTSSGPEETKSPAAREGNQGQISPTKSSKPIYKKATGSNGALMPENADRSANVVASIKSKTIVDCGVTIDEMLYSKIKMMESSEAPVTGTVSSMIKTIEKSSPPAIVRTRAPTPPVCEATMPVIEAKMAPVESAISDIYSAETVEKVKKRRAKGQERHSDEGLKVVESTSTIASTSPSTGTLDVSTHLDTPSLLVELRAWRDIELEADESFIRGLRQTRKDLEDRLELLRLREE